MRASILGAVWQCGAAVGVGALALSQGAVARADESGQYWHSWGATLGAGLDAGRVGNATVGIPSRWISALTGEALVGYRALTDTLFGLDFTYRFQRQLTSVASVGDRFDGHGWSLGPALQYRFSDAWAFQGAFDLFGQLAFEGGAGVGTSRLDWPLGLRLKAQYFFADPLPLSADLGGSVESLNVHPGPGVASSSRLTQWTLGVGTTFHFGATRVAAHGPETEAPAASASSERDTGAG